MRSGTVSTGRNFIPWKSHWSNNNTPCTVTRLFFYSSSRFQIERHLRETWLFSREEVFDHLRRDKWPDRALNYPRWYIKQCENYCLFDKGDKKKRISLPFGYHGICQNSIFHTLSLIVRSLNALCCMRVYHFDWRYFVLLCNLDKCLTSCHLRLYHYVLFSREISYFHLVYRCYV